MLRQMARHVRLLGLLAAVLLAGCGGGGGDDALVVSAASSLRGAFPAYAHTAGQDAHFSFAGSDELAAQIRSGAHPDVYAAANTKLPLALFAEHKVERPVVFATNRLVLAVPAKSSIRSLAAAARRGVKVVVGAPSVPVGAYTEKVLAALPAGVRRGLQRNIASKEPDVGTIAGKLQAGAGDAGFVYITDVRAAKGALRPVFLPKSASPDVSYGVAVVAGAKHRDQAQAFVNGLLSGKGARALRAAGFGPPPQTLSGTGRTGP